MHSKIIGSGSYLPKKIITNDDLAKVLDTSDEWIKTRTGIGQRHIADRDGGEGCAYMGAMAARRALTMAGLEVADLDLIITATVTADQRVPTASCAIHHILEADHVPAFDLSAACAGSIYGLSIADSFIRNGTYKNVLFIASEVMSSVVDWTDRNTAVLFGDGASAAVLSASDGKSGFIDFDLYADGSQERTIFVEAGGSAHTIDQEAIEKRQDKLYMNGRETFKFAVRAMCEAIERILLDNDLHVRDIDIAVPHQANLRIIEAIAKRLDLPMSRFLVNLDRCANTSAASLLLAYDEALRAGRLRSGNLMLMLAIGAGFVWGSALYRV